MFRRLFFLLLYFVVTVPVTEELTKATVCQGVVILGLGVFKYSLVA